MSDSFPTSSENLPLENKLIDTKIYGSITINRKIEIHPGNKIIVTLELSGITTKKDGTEALKIYPNTAAELQTEYPNYEIGFITDLTKLRHLLSLPFRAAINAVEELGHFPKFKFSVAVLESATAATFLDVLSRLSANKNAVPTLIVHSRERAEELAQSFLKGTINREQ